MILSLLINFYNKFTIKIINQIPDEEEGIEVQKVAERIQVIIIFIFINITYIMVLFRLTKLMMIFLFLNQII